MVRAFSAFAESVPARSPSRPPPILQTMGPLYAVGGREGERAGSEILENALVRAMDELDAGLVAITPTDLALVSLTGLFPQGECGWYEVGPSINL